jgi:SAM-dependent methyltransferase
VIVMDDERRALPDPTPGRRALVSDFDGDPERFAANQLATESFSVAGDVHDRVADWLAQSTTGLTLDVGGGNGVLAKALAKRDRRTVVVDCADYVRTAPRPAVQADAMRLPFKAERFAAVAALWMLYYMDQPDVALVEAARVLQPDGIFVACTCSRYNDPEFASVLPDWGQPFSFDSESAPEIVANHFQITEVVEWDTPAVRLHDAPAVALFLRGRGLSAEEASKHAYRWRTPLTVTKRGCLIWARRRRPANQG